MKNKIKKQHDACADCYGFCCVTDISHPLTRLTNSDIERIAKNLEIPIYRFREDYVEQTCMGRIDPHIKFQPGPCIFFTGGLCGINKVKPDTCRNFNPKQQTFGNLSCKQWNKMRALGIQ